MGQNLQLLVRKNNHPKKKVFTKKNTDFLIGEGVGIDGLIKEKDIIN